MAFNVMAAVFLTIIALTIDPKVAQESIASGVKTESKVVQPEVIQPETKTLYERVEEDFDSDAKADKTYSTERTLIDHFELIKGFYPF